MPSPDTLHPLIFLATSFRNIFLMWSHVADVGNVADVSEVHTASIFNILV
jgi:hypothetical protein